MEKFRFCLVIFHARVLLSLSKTLVHQARDDEKKTEKRRYVTYGVEMFVVKAKAASRLAERGRSRGQVIEEIESTRRFI